MGEPLIRCHARDGSITFDSTMRVTRVLGYFDTGTEEGSFTHPDIASGEAFFIIVKYYGPTYMRDVPIAVANGNTVSWQFERYTYNIGRVSARMMFGVAS